MDAGNRVRNSAGLGENYCVRTNTLTVEFGNHR